MAEKEIVLRDYQKECIDKIDNAEPGKYLVALATGLGKTVVFSHIDRKGRVLILSHRDELVHQPIKYYDCPVGVEKASEHANGEEVVSASVPSISRDKRLENYKPDDFDTIIVDEAHHATAASYRKVLSYFHPRMLLGFTATPKRGDKQNLKDVFDSILYEKDTKWGIRNHYLCDVRSYKVTAELNLKTVKKTMGDYNEGALGRRILESNAVEVVAKAYMQYCRAMKRHTLIFCVSVKVCEAVVEKLRGLLPEKERDRIQMITGSTPQEERNSISSRFMEGKIDCIVNCMVFTEGTDLPIVDAIINLRPTCNSLLYQQIVGRGLRMFPNKKDCLIFDVLDAGKKEKKICTAPGLFGIDESALPEKMKKAVNDHALLSEMDEGIDEGIESIKVSGKDIRLRATEYNLFVNSLVDSFIKKFKGGKDNPPPAQGEKDQKDTVTVDEDHEEIPEELSGLAVSVLPFDKEKYFVRFSHGDFTFSEPNLLGNVEMKINYNGQVIAGGSISMLKGAQAARVFIQRYSDPAQAFLWSAQIRDSWHGRPATDKQIWAIKNMKKNGTEAVKDMPDDVIESLDKSEASQLIDAVKTSEQFKEKASSVPKAGEPDRNDPKFLEMVSRNQEEKKRLQGMLDRLSEYAEKFEESMEAPFFKFHIAVDSRYRNYANARPISEKQKKYLYDVINELRASGGMLSKSLPDNLPVFAMEGIIGIMRPASKSLMLMRKGASMYLFNTDAMLKDIYRHFGEQSYDITVQCVRMDD